jgi:hypothetical protein
VTYIPIEITTTDWIVAFAAVAAVLTSAALIFFTHRQVSIMKKQATILENQEREKLKARLIAKLITLHNRSAIEGNVSLLIFNNEPISKLFIPPLGITLEGVA